MKIQIIKDCSLEVISRVNSAGEITASVNETFLAGEQHEVQIIDRDDQVEAYTVFRFGNDEICYIPNPLWQEIK